MNKKPGWQPRIHPAIAATIKCVAGDCRRTTVHPSGRCWSHRTQRRTRPLAIPGHHPPAAIWVLFDHSNGLDGAKNYAFWFETRSKAKDYKRDLDMRRARGENIVKTTGPFKYAR